jgi:predicted nucleic acid-binding Zn ribbon protein
VRRLIGTGGGIIFKGSGFYQTDYRSDSYKKAQKAEKDSSSTKSDSDSTKKDTKPEKKKEASKKEPAGCASKT